ncbi:MAG: hypothetical protein QM750_07205 [Rubrivivax sp.]
MYGLKVFASFTSVSFRHVVTMSFVIAVAAFVGSVLQNASTDALQSVIQFQGAFMRSAFWVPVLVVATLFWRRLQPGPIRISTREALSVLIPVVVGTLLADALAISTSFVPYAADKAELVKVMQDKQAQDNAVFFAVLAGVTTWRINRVLQQRGNGKSP